MVQNLKAHDSAHQGSPAGSLWAVVCLRRATKCPAAIWVHGLARPAWFVSQHSFPFTGAFVFLLLLQARLLPVCCALSTYSSYVDRLPCTSRTRTFNVNNGEAVSNPCPNCNLGYCFQILQICPSDPFTSLYWSWPFFMFCLLFKMNLA